MSRILPPELLANVFEYIDETRDLMSIGSCSKQFRTLSKPLLYGRIVTDNYGRDGSLQERSEALLRQSVDAAVSAFRDHLKDWVIDITIDTSGDSEASAQLHEELFLRKFPAILRKLSKLKNLDLYLSYD